MFSFTRTCDEVEVVLSTQTIIWLGRDCERRITADAREEAEAIRGIPTLRSTYLAKV
jgi:hypothetical protein